jgi:3-oxoacyl-[acyl-carrier protein] reductase
MSELTGKVALVTGSSKGIGTAIAKAISKAGASVVVNYSSDKDGADKVVSAIIAAGGTAVAIKGDVTKESDAKNWSRVPWVASAVSMSS